MTKTTPPNIDAEAKRDSACPIAKYGGLLVFGERVSQALRPLFVAGGAKRTEAKALGAMAVGGRNFHPPASAENIVSLALTPPIAPFEREFDGIQRLEQSRVRILGSSISHVGVNESAGCFFYVKKLPDDARFWRVKTQ